MHACKPPPSPPHAHSFVDILEITSIEILCLVLGHSNSAVYCDVPLKMVETVVRDLQYYFIMQCLFFPLFLVRELHTDVHNDTSSSRS